MEGHLPLFMKFTQKRRLWWMSSEIKNHSPTPGWPLCSGHQSYFLPTFNLLIWVSLCFLQARSRKRGSGFLTCLPSGFLSRLNEPSRDRTSIMLVLAFCWPVFKADSAGPFPTKYWQGFTILFRAAQCCAELPHKMKSENLPGMKRCENIYTMVSENSFQHYVTPETIHWIGWISLLWPFDPSPHRKIILIVMRKY